MSSPKYVISYSRASQPFAHEERTKRGVTKFLKQVSGTAQNVKVYERTRDTSTSHKLEEVPLCHF